MGRELSGVIACLQELEAACDVLQDREGLSRKGFVPLLRTKIREFFSQPSVGSATQVLNFILRERELKPADEGNQNPLTSPVIIDGHATCLEGLAEELQEVLEEF